MKESPQSHRPDRKDQIAKSRDLEGEKILPECDPCPEAWKVSRWWELSSCLEPRNKDEHSLHAWSWQIEHILIEALKPGESLIFRISRESDDTMSWGLGLQCGSSERWEAINLVLRSIGQSFTFEEKAAMSDPVDCRWLELLPKTKSIPLEDYDLETGGGVAIESDDELLSVPDFRWDWRLHRLPHLVAECSELHVVEVAISGKSKSENRDGLKILVEDFFKRWGNPLETEDLAALRENLTEKNKHELRCRVAINQDAPTGAWGVVLGREVFRSEAVLVENQEVKEASETSQFFEGGDLPLLIPSFDLLRETGTSRRYNRRIPKLSSEGVVAGTVEGSLLRLPESGRARHTYVVGATGTGKSTLLFNMIQQDLENGEGVIVLDPHGDLCEQVFAAVPKERADSVIVMDPGSTKSIPGFNPLDLPDDRFRGIRASYITGEFIHLFHQLWGSVPEAFGPMFELYFRNALLLLMRNQSSSEHSLADFSRVFTDRDFRRHLLDTAELPRVKDFWENLAEKPSGECSLENITPYITSKLDFFINGGFLSQVISPADTNKLQFNGILDQKKILLVNLNKGLIGSQESRILGMLLLMQIFSAALGRSLQPASSRIPCHLYVDEFQNFVSDGMAEMLSESRKFGLRLTLANQTLQQLNAHRGMNNLLDSVLGNVGNLISFRLGVRDSELLEPFTRPFTPSQMQRLPNFHAFAQVMDAEGPMEPVVMKTLNA